MKKSLFQIRNLNFGFRNLAFRILHCASVSLLFLLVIAPFSSYANDGDISGKWWKNPRIIRELDLSNDQINQIEAIFSSRRDQMRELDSRLKEKDAQLRNMARNPNSRREEVLRLNDEVENMKGNMRRIRVDMLLQIRDVLTPQQRSKLQEMRGR